MVFKTTLIAKANLLQPGTDKFRAVASTLKAKCGFDLEPQMDLLYVESCLVSAGKIHGINDNDDIFTPEEAWAARTSPILKPFNWQHTDKDIVGVMYTVQARDLDGNVLDIDNPTPPDCEFDLWTEAAIFRLIYPERSREIESRAEANDLFVSMEAWFDDYHYGLYTKESGVVKTIARNESTSFLESYLKVSGGAGKYVDPDNGQEMRIGRVLRSITYGGCGFVDRPANKRSKIESVKPMQEMAAYQDDIKALFERVLKLEEITENEEIFMSTNANLNDDKSLTADQVKAAVGSVIEQREADQAKAAEQEALRTRAAEAEQAATELKAKVADLEQSNTDKTAQVEALEQQMKDYNTAVDSLIQTEAGATKDTPAEIAAIDGASDVFTAKLAWLEKSRASVSETLARAAELEASLAEAQALVREQSVRSLLGEYVTDETLDTFVSHASDLDENGFETWIAEKELMLIDMNAIAAKDDKKLPPFMKKGKEGKDGDKKEGDAKGNVFTALLQRRRVESGAANPDTMNSNPNEPTHLINQTNTGDTVNSGVNSSGLKTPRHKIAGSAGSNPAATLDNAQADNSGVNLAGASVGGEGGEEVNPFRTVANIVAGGLQGNKEKDLAKKPGFDPVQN